MCVIASKAAAYTTQQGLDYLSDYAHEMSILIARMQIDPLPDVVY